MAEGNAKYDSRNGCNAIIETSSNTLIAGCSSTVIPESVTSIGDQAFYNCSSLTSIAIPESVTSIGDWAFSGCGSLTSITIPESVTSIGKTAFVGCTGNLFLKCNISSSVFISCNFDRVTVEGMVSSLDNGAFTNCNIKELVIIDGDNPLWLGNSEDNKGLFSNCTITSIYLGRNLDYNKSPFSDNDAIVKVYVGNCVTEIGSNLFGGCDNICSLTISDRVSTIGYNAFSSPAKVIWLTNTPPIGYEYAVGRINYVANEQYADLDNVQIYAYLTSMFEVDGVTYVPVSPSERTCHVIDCDYDGIVANLNVDDVVSFKGVSMKITEIMPYAFYKNDYIKTVSISYIGNIGDYAFYDCDSMEVADINNISDANAWGFVAPQISLPNWNSSNHENNSHSEKIYSFTTVSNATLSFRWAVDSEKDYDYLYVYLDGYNVLMQSGNYSGTRTITVGAGEHTLGVGYKKDEINSRGTDQASISDIMVTYVDEWIVNAGVGCCAFSDCSSLKSVAFGDGVGSLGFKAFCLCTSLQEIVIPTSMKFIGLYCFSGCSSMKNATIETGHIPKYMFSDCIALQELNIENSVNSIGDYAFLNCVSLADIIIEDRTTPLGLGSNGSASLFSDCSVDSVYIGGFTVNTSNSYKQSPFYSNASLRVVTIDGYVTEVFERDFFNCCNLEKVTIGDGVNSIGNYAFHGCSRLASLCVGRGLRSIGEDAFSDCVNLMAFTIHATIPPICGAQALDDINKWNCVLQVPVGSISVYQAADQWKDFFFFEEVEAGVSPTSLDIHQPTIVYDLNGRRVNISEDKIRELTKGIYILNGRKFLINGL